MTTVESQSQSQSSGAQSPDAATPPHYDELVDASGSVREHWQSIYQSLMVERIAQLPQYNALTEKLLRDDGASYSIYNDSAGLSRAWPLDVLPMLLPQTEWDVVDTGVAQRAKILDLVYQDIYGPQRLLREGILPPALVFGHPGYMRTWVGAPEEGQKQLTIYGVDLARNNDGHFCAISERTQNPSGSGYALENRIVSARVLPDLYRESRILRLASYFSSLRETLIKLAGENNANPRIVLLTPGSRNETYFDQTFLSSYLGITLVEGQDLIVRKGRVWIRSLSGEEPVDVIVRRVDDDYCDPLEFRGDSLLGVVGLTEVARAGNVQIVNPLGSGVLENPGLFGYLPKIAKYFGESELLLEQVDSWWCGEPENLKYALEHLKKLVIKPVWRQREQRSVACSTLSQLELENLANRIKNNPMAFVAQEQIQLSQAPCHNVSGTESRGLVLRAFATVYGDGYQVMPGGLVRVRPSSQQNMISSHGGSLSKDCWILSSEQESEQSLWVHPKHKLTDSAPEKQVYGRSAENLFWMGRYAERADTALNLLRNFGQPQLGTENTDYSVWQLIFVTDITFTYPGFKDNTKYNSIESINQELYSLSGDATRNGTLADSLTRMTEASNNVNGLLSSEFRRVVGQLQFETKKLQQNNTPFSEMQFEGLIRIKDLLLTVNGLIGQSMIRGLAWRFLDIGRRIERAQRLLRMLQLLLVFGDENEEVELEKLFLILSVTDSEVSYRQRYVSDITVDRVLDLLLLEPDNPKSVAWQISSLVEHLDNLPVRGENRVVSKERRAIVEADTRVRLANSLELAEFDKDSNQRSELNNLLSGLIQQMQDAGDAIGDSYFDKITEKQQTLSPVLR